MSTRKSRLGWMGAGLALVLGSTLVVGQVRGAGDAKPAGEAKPAAAKPAAAGGTVKLTKPWSEIASLSEEQKTKIHEIHTKALAQVSEIEKQEKADIMALLTDAQKADLKEAAAKDKKEAADRKVKKATATTAPAAK